MNNTVKVKDQLSPTFAHNENTFDPRDKHLVTINKEKKLIITEASDLKAAGITPKIHYQTIGGAVFYIWMYSPKVDATIPFKFLKNKRTPDGDVIAAIFVADFPSIWNKKLAMARELLQGWELHILND